MRSWLLCLKDWEFLVHDHMCINTMRIWVKFFGNKILGLGTTFKIRPSFKSSMHMRKGFLGKGMNTESFPFIFKPFLGFPQFSWLVSKHGEQNLRSNWADAWGSLIGGGYVRQKEMDAFIRIGRGPLTLGWWKASGVIWKERILSIRNDACGVWVG